MSPSHRHQECETKTWLAATWNIAAVNNNPFEYWVTHNDPAYNKMMVDVQDFIDEPGSRDCPIHEVLTDEMFDELVQHLDRMKCSGLDKLRDTWVSEYRSRKIISGFLKERSIGSKRLISMPDRVTNTIHAADGTVFYRPTAINCYDGNFENKSAWWGLWQKFIFDTQILVHNAKKRPEGYPCLVFQMLEPILKCKYPAITEEEELICIPLQTLCLAIFDAIIIHMLDCVAPQKWQTLRKSLSDALYKGKDRQIIEILSRTYKDAAFVFLQEVAASFVKKVEAGSLCDDFIVFKPAKMDGKRDQNSIIMVKKDLFDLTSARDVTNEILAAVEDWQCSDGDLVAYTIQSKDLCKYLLVSFHGDTNGLATLPVVRAVHAVASSTYSDHALVFGLDANTYREHSATYQGVSHFYDVIASMGMASCWGTPPNPVNPTTCNARTYLQPQLNKAIGQKDKIAKADKNLKDWIVFYQSQLKAEPATKDNTGCGKYVEEMVFPTLDFPSDHAVVASKLCVPVRRNGTT
uniref:Endonuclease/exonuclease/phosphatase domain-containing protein n=1 Tax=Guillardia theta TaxID=55529 RepID=A0A7S4K8E8_GUITH